MFLITDAGELYRDQQQETVVVLGSTQNKCECEVRMELKESSESPFSVQITVDSAACRSFVFCVFFL